MTVRYANRIRRRVAQVSPVDATQLLMLQLGLLAFCIAAIWGSYAKLERAVPATDRHVGVRQDARTRDGSRDTADHSACRAEEAITCVESPDTSAGTTSEAHGDAILRRMCGAIRHRGPDDEGRASFSDAALGMRRLSIIDVAGGHQPMTNEDGTVHVVFNGEIYNHRTLRPELERRGHRFRTSSDTETLVHLYEDYGPSMATPLRGHVRLRDLGRRAGGALYWDAIG